MDLGGWGQKLCWEWRGAIKHTLGSISYLIRQFGTFHKQTLYLSGVTVWLDVLVKINVNSAEFQVKLQLSFAK